MTMKLAQRFGMTVAFGALALATMLGSQRLADATVAMVTAPATVDAVQIATASLPTD